MLVGLSGGGIFLSWTIPIQTKTHDFLYFHKDGFNFNFKFIANFGLQKHCCRFRVLEKLIGEEEPKVEERESWKSEYYYISPNCGARTIYVG